MSIPNIITLIRVFLVPIVFWLLLNGEMKAAFFLFVVAGISDGVDGFLAKRYGMATELGAYLDPLADKLLLVCIFLALGFAGHIPSWLVIGVVMRDLLIVTGVMLSWLLGNPVPIHPQYISKTNTVAQIVLAAVVMADLGFGLGLANLRTALVWITAALVVASLAAYARTWLLHMSGYEVDAPQLKAGHDAPLRRDARNERPTP
ncbi:MAG: CDP-alcohol phosphatidyltransferase family protein [Hyphomicrobiaceae bacterium]